MTRRCILTGLGGRGLYWAGEVLKHPQLELAACVEPDAGRRQTAINHGVPADRILPSLDEAISRCGRADFVVDVTPPAVHPQIATRAFAQGMHVLSEKPLADDYQVARRLAARGREAGVRHMVAQNYRFGPCARTMRRLVQEKAVGDLGQVDVQFYKAWADVPGSHYVTQPFMVINDMMVHHFDLMRYLVGSVPVAVQAITWNHSWGWHQGDAAHAIVFEFPGGLWATHVTVACSVGETPRDYYGSWRLDGSGGSLGWSDGRIHRAHLARTPRKVREEIFPDPAPEGARGILDEFLAALEADREPECSAADNLHSLAMVFAAIRSAVEHRRVELAEME